MSPTRQCRAEGDHFDPFWRFNHTNLKRFGVLDNSGIRHYQYLPVYCDFASVVFKKSLRTIYKSLLVSYPTLFGAYNSGLDMQDFKHMFLSLVNWIVLIDPDHILHYLPYSYFRF